METITYDIPASLAATFRQQRIIVRCHDPVELLPSCDEDYLADLAYVKLLSLQGEVDSLKAWGHGIPVELVVADIFRDLPLLYRYVPLLAVHPIRVSVPLLPGLSRVVKLAVSLNFAVKMQGGQPEKSLFQEMQQIVDLYLYQPMVSEPIEFFHSLFLAFYHRTSATLWAIQEEDSSFVRHITDRGEEMMPGRLAGIGTRGDFSNFVQEVLGRPASEQSECLECRFLTHCQGYFKWPRREYRCDGVQALLLILQNAAKELQADVSSFRCSGEGRRT